MSDCGCRKKNPYAMSRRRRNYGDSVDGVWTEERIARSLEVGLISPETAAMYRATLGQTSKQRDSSRQALVCKAMNGDAGAEATLRSYGLDWRSMPTEQAACEQKKKMMTYGAVAAGIGALALFMSKGKK